MHKHITTNLANLDFGDLRITLTRFNFSCNLTGNQPQSTTNYAVKR